MSRIITHIEHDEENFLSEEAKADAAPVATEIAYASRTKWKPGVCAGFIINTTAPVARLKWPKKRDAKVFFQTIRGNNNG